MRFGNPILGPFGEKLSEIVIPHHMLRVRDIDEQPNLVDQSPDGIVFELGGAAYRYDRLGLRRERECDEPARRGADPS